MTRALTSPLRLGPPRHRLRSTAVVATAVLTAVTTTGTAVEPASRAAHTAVHVAVDVAVEWFDTTAATIAAAGAPTQVTNSRTWAIGWLAAARALRAGGDRPAGAPRAAGGRGAYADAALASAVHTTLTGLVPARRAELDAALATTLARIPDGADRDRGVAAGAREARSLLAQRSGDGLDPASVNRPYTPPPPLPGVWRPTPPDHLAGTQSGNRLARPFVLDRADRFRPEPPPALGSARYREDLAEVRAYGAADSTVRTQAQTDTAQFWLGSSYAIYVPGLRAALVQSRRPPAERAALVALFHVASVDTQIATSDAKYAYTRWRPVTAIRAEDDGDPATAPDPDWTPLHVTPPHPDYPSGHATYAGAAEEVFTTLAGGPRPREPYTLTSPTAPGVTRTYTTWRRPSQENVDARVWSGIHTRTADTAGVRLGRQVAAHVLRNAGRLL
ncbi:hypothetical protein Misp01_16240 [Microtetraspora sp. NBRC 13810]|uniref:vanadium-dependent haloperoxidase n=1 Tax=Microtetraspora sp. NBRC 13810 TaxID=3030990 RepID=UPI0024A4FC72|nr:vanadium-dependent haloperoxidase [Microtetraspora sp. NBRC 13810]GLW06494.1 hypothetical protein Misp01_16240 [Microtetraspora sp. NBRC 13810]